MSTKTNIPKKAKAKEQKAVSRAVKQAGFKNIKEAKQALREANKKVKYCCKSNVEDDCCDSKKSCSYASLTDGWKNINSIISCKAIYDPVENCDIVIIKVQS